MQEVLLMSFPRFEKSISGILAASPHTGGFFSSLKINFDVCLFLRIIHILCFEQYWYYWNNFLWLKGVPPRDNSEALKEVFLLKVIFQWFEYHRIKKKMPLCWGVSHPQTSHNLTKLIQSLLHGYIKLIMYFWYE